MSASVRPPEPRELDLPFPLFATALRRALAAGYGRAELFADLTAGLVVGVVAIPLSMALAVAVGVPPALGLVTAVVGGLAAALLGGSAAQVTGPTAAFVVVLAPIAQRHGLRGLLIAGLLAGLLLLGLGLSRAGRLVEFIPHPVTTGFTAGIAVVIATLQVPSFFGTRLGELGESFPGRVVAIARSLPTARVPDTAVGLGTLAVLIAVPWLTRRVPPALVALPLAAATGWALEALWPELGLETIGSRFSTVVDGGTVRGLPRAVPTLALPWGAELPSFEELRELMPSAMVIAVLGAIESLLSAVVADGMTGKRHDPDAELVGQGAANVLTALFGGIAATGALARTALNVRSGARSPVAAATHGVVVLLAVLLLAPALAYLPMAALAALLIMVAWRMAELEQVAFLVRAAPRSDVVVLITCFGLTVLFDMVVAVSVGVVLAALLFMRRMAALLEVSTLFPEDHPADSRASFSTSLPSGVVLYEIAGPLFFGAARRAVAALDLMPAEVRLVVLDLSRVPVIDATGLVALEGALLAFHGADRFVLLAGAQPRVLAALDRARLEARHRNVLAAPTVAEAILTAADLSRLHPEWRREAATDAGGS